MGQQETQVRSVKAKQQNASVKTYGSTSPKKASTCITINGQEIPWSFVQMLRVKYCRGDWDTTLDAFWKARNAKGPNAILKYIRKGIYDALRGERYIFHPSRERENGQMESIREWWQTLYEHHPRSPVMSVRDVFAALASGEIK